MGYFLIRPQESETNASFVTKHWAPFQKGRKFQCVVFAKKSLKAPFLSSQPSLDQVSVKWCPKEGDLGFFLGEIKNDPFFSACELLISQNEKVGNPNARLRNLAHGNRRWPGSGHRDEGSFIAPNPTSGQRTKRYPMLAEKV